MPIHRWSQAAGTRGAKVGRTALVTLAAFLALPALAQPAPILSPEEMSADFEYLIDALNTVHPDIHRYRNADETKRLADSIRQRLKEPMDPWSFYRVIAPYAAGGLDGHTFVRGPERFSSVSESQPVILPLDIVVEGDTLRVGRSFGEAAVLEPGMLIHAINGNTAAEITANFRGQYADIIPKNDVYSSGFGAFYFAGFGASESFELHYDDGERIVLNGLTLAASNELRAESEDAGSNEIPESFRLYYPDDHAGVAVIEVNMMRDIEAFAQFSRASFSEISDREIETLIIDFRRNEGGDSRIGDIIFAHIADEGPSDWQVLIKASDQFRSHFTEDIADDPVLAEALTAKNGALVPEPASVGPAIVDPGPIFGGEVYLLTSGFTYSSASMFAGVFACDNLGTIIGQPTGQATNFFGELTVMTLPNSGLQFLSSMKEFKAPCNASATRSVMPQIAVPAEDAMDTALRHAAAS